MDRSTIRRHAAALAGMVLAALALVLLLPGAAMAKSYSMPRVDIQAEVLPDGSLHVVEQRDFDFDGSFTCVWWELDLDEFEVNGVRLSGVSQAPLDLDEAPFETLWRSEGGPGRAAWSVDEAYGTLYVFFSASDVVMTAQIDYTVPARGSQGVQAYDDVAELYWKFVGSGWAEDSRDVTCTVALPVPAGAQPGAEDVRAWGHGSLDGGVELADDRSQVRYHVDRVRSGEFAEARIVFPSSWVSAPEAASHAGERLSSVLAEEQAWADSANRERTAARAMAGVLVVVAMALVAFALVAWARFGREHKPRFCDDYWRDVPERGVHPAAIGRLWRFGGESSDDFTATLLHLCNIGAVAIARGTYPDRKGRPVQDYYLAMRKAPDELRDPIDVRAMRFLFGTIAGGAESLWLDSIKRYGKEHPEAFSNQMEQWQGLVTADANARGFFEKEGSLWQGVLLAVGVAAIFIGLGAAVLFENFLPLFTLGPAGVAVMVVSHFMPRRSRGAVETYARCQALRRWLREFSALDERPPTDVQVWGEFMVYAYLFGVADEAIAQLRRAVPQVFERDRAFAADNSWCVPWYHLYVYDGPMGRNAVSFSDAFSTTWTNTVSTVSAALSSDSDGGGFGGGFSGSGGGGFGGGGGGAR